MSHSAISYVVTESVVKTQTDIQARSMKHTSSLFIRQEMVIRENVDVFTLF